MLARDEVKRVGSSAAGTTAPREIGYVSALLARFKNSNARNFSPTQLSTFCQMKMDAVCAASARSSGNLFQQISPRYFLSAGH